MYRFDNLDFVALSTTAVICPGYLTKYLSCHSHYHQHIKQFSFIIVLSRGELLYRFGNLDFVALSSHPRRPRHKLRPHPQGQSRHPRCGRIGECPSIGRAVYNGSDLTWALTLNVRIIYIVVVITKSEIAVEKPSNHCALARCVQT